MTGWTDRAYDALFDWSNSDKKDQAEQTLLAHGLYTVVVRLQTSRNMGVWYQIVKEAVEAVGPGGVARGAKRARQQLDAFHS